MPAVGRKHGFPVITTAFFMQKERKNMEAVISMEQFNQMLSAESSDDNKLIAALKQLMEVKDLGLLQEDLLPDSPAWTGWW